MSNFNTIVSEIDPMVSLKLSDYEKIMKYIKILEDAPTADNQYKKAFEDFLNRMNRDNMAASPINNMMALDYNTQQIIKAKLDNALDAYGLRLERSGNIYESQIKIVPK